MRGFPGVEQSLDTKLSWFERVYVRCLGVPVNGLRIRLRRVLPATRGSYQRILDAGSGPGVFAMELAKRNPRAEVVGLDADQEAVDRSNAIARRAGISNCSFRTGDVTSLDFSEEFDLVIAVDILEHIENDVGAMKNLNRVLGAGGRLVVHVPGYFRRWFIFRRTVNFDVPGHVRPGYRAEDLRAKLQDAGFEVISQNYTYGFLETLSNNVSYLISGASRRNKKIYAVVFPFLLALSYPGRFFSPEWGAGLLTVATRPQDGATEAQEI